MLLLSLTQSPRPAGKYNRVPLEHGAGLVAAAMGHERMRVEGYVQMQTSSLMHLKSGLPARVSLPNVDEGRLEPYSSDESK